ncbi:MAG: MaoC family dehydratase [Oscillospiraceae bacterium]|nr:MaoC family dehydratase [Oscillospiraceae bacterium]
MPEYKYYEDFQIGEEQEGFGRQMTEADIRLFIGCTDNVHPVHLDPRYCEASGLKGPIVHGVMTLGVADGFMAREISPTKVPTVHYGHEKIRYIKPVYPGDTLYCKSKVTEKAVKNDEFGIVTWDITVYNQHDEAVLFHVDKQYIGRRPSD